MEKDQWILEQSQEIMARLRERHEERGKLLAQLEMWAKVKAQGIDPETVDRFGFDPKLLTPEQRRAYRNAAQGSWYDIDGKRAKTLCAAKRFRRLPDPITGRIEDYDPAHPYTGPRLSNGHHACLIYNYLIMKDGTKRPINPIKAV
jgi:hypothetical protein